MDVRDQLSFTLWLLIYAVILPRVLAHVKALWSISLGL